MLPSQPNQSLIDGLTCLQALTSAQEPMGSRELARLLDMEPTRANRLLKTLAYLGLAEQDERRKYSPGTGIHVLAAQALRGSGLIGRALPALEELRDLGYIVALGVLWRDETCYLYHADADATIAHALSYPAVYPAATSGIGMALMAHMPDDQVRELYARPSVLPAKRKLDEPVELDGPDGLLARLDRIRMQGHALVSVPQVEGRRTLAVAIGNPAYAAVGLSGAFTDQQVPDLLAELDRTVEAISTAPGVDGHLIAR
jgi:DNA-binding IclR family transcriptional regulator